MHSDCVCLHLALQAVHLLPGETGEGEEGTLSKESQGGRPAPLETAHHLGLGPDEPQLDGRCSHSQDPLNLSTGTSKLIGSQNKWDSGHFPSLTEAHKPGSSAHANCCLGRMWRRQS